MSGEDFFLSNLGSPSCKLKIEYTSSLLEIFHVVTILYIRFHCYPKLRSYLMIISDLLIF